MVAVILLARIALAGVFTLASVTKLLDRKGFERGLTQFGVSDQFAGGLSYVIPLAEIAVAAAFLIDWLALVAAAFALVLLGAFSVAITVSLVRGRRPECHCFGVLKPEPIGSGVLIRNGILGGLSALVLLRGQGLQVDTVLIVRPALAGILTGALVILVAAESWFLLRVLQQQGRMLARLDGLEGAKRRAGLPVNDPAPGFQLPDANGQLRSLQALVDANRPVMLIFVSPTCRTCHALLPEIATWQQQLREHLTILLISTGTAESNRPLLAYQPAESVLLQADTEVFSAYESPGPPSAVLVGPAGTIASRLASGPVEIRALVGEILGTGEPSARVLVTAS